VERWAIASKWHLKKIADGEPWTMPTTIDDRAILYEIARLLKDKGVRDCL